MDFKSGGKDYFQKMCSGYISYYRGANPLLFAKKVDIGDIPNGLIFTKCVRCQMSTFQQNSYDRVKINTDDPLERGSSSAANIVFPGLSKDKKFIDGYYGEEGVNVVRSNLKTNKIEYLNKLNQMFFGGKIKNVEDIIYNSNNKEILDEVVNCCPNSVVVFYGILDSRDNTYDKYNISNYSMFSCQSYKSI